MAIFLGVKHFKEQLEARNVIIFTDHKPLTFAMMKTEATTNKRQARQLDYISQYCTDIRHIEGEKNSAADALSRISALAPTAVTATEVAKAQEADEELKDVLEGKKKTSLKLIKHKDLLGTTLYVDTTSRNKRPFIPKSLRNAVIAQIHNVAHPGTKSARRLVSDSFVWPSLQLDCKNFVKTCIPCQESKVGRHTHTPLFTPVPPIERFKEINIDLIGPYAPSKGYTYCLAVIDRFTRWSTAIPIKDATAATVATALVAGWVQHHGTPHRIQSDQGTCFTANLFHELNVMLDTHHIKTTAYHPPANGIIERWHRTLKNAIKCPRRQTG